MLPSPDDCPNGYSSAAVTIESANEHRQDAAPGPSQCRQAPSDLDGRDRAPKAGECRLNLAPHPALTSTGTNRRMPLAEEPRHLAADHFRRFATSRHAVRIANPGATNPKRNRNPAEYPGRAWASIFAAPSMSPPRSAPMANTPHTSSPEKPERSMPQRHRTDPVLSIGTPAENCRNSSRDHELSGLRTVRSSFRTYATASPPVRSLSAAHGEGLPIIGQLLGHRRVETTVCHASCARLGPGIRRAYRRQHSSRYSLGAFARFEMTVLMPKPWSASQRSG